MDTIVGRLAKSRLPKRKMALVLGYLGTGYQGIQYNPPAHTIDSELFKALVATNCISQSNSDYFSKSSFSRATRTDKDVHALTNLVALKMQRYEVPQQVKAELNEILPDDIRIWDVVPVKKKFNARVMAGTRHYRYVIPTFLLQCGPHSDLSTSQLARFKNIWNMFLGTHNYYNFTPRRKDTNADSPQNMRHMYSIQVSDPFTIAGSTQWLSIAIHGQSFLLHQIRKMVHYALSEYHRSSSDTKSMELLETVDPDLTSATALDTPTEQYIPLAPAAGLYLHHPTFEGYNNQPAARRLQVLDLSGYPACATFEDRIHTEIARSEHVFHEYMAVIRQ